MLLLIDPSVASAEREAAERIASIWGGPTALVRPALDGWGELAVDGPWSAVVVMGSAASARDASPWRDRLLALVRSLLAASHPPPLLGICYGHQLLGLAAGAPVGPATADGSKLFGLRTLAVEASPLFEDGQRELRAAVSHREMLQAVPAGFRRIASHGECPIHGIQHASKPLFGLQCHPELPDVALERMGDAGPSDPRRLADGAAVLGRFFGLAHRHERAV